MNPVNELHFLTSDECEVLLRIARTAIDQYVNERATIDLDGYALTPRLQRNSGAFVTLRKAGELRGCIGYTKGLEPLADTVRDSAVNAATRDPRFPPLTAEELPEVRIEISALALPEDAKTSFVPVNDVAEIEIGRDGLYLENAGERGGGLLLPQVAANHDWDVSQFLDAICEKAGAPHDAWRAPEAKLYRFSAQVFAED